MAGRNHLPPPSSLARAISERHVIQRQHHHLEDRIAIQHREIQSLLLDNQRLAAIHVALKQELTLAEQELRHLSAAASNVKAERDAEVREFYEKSLKMDAEARAVDAMSAELARVRADVQNFVLEREELTAQLDAVNDELAKARAEANQLPVVKAEIEALHQEINKGRSAVELEKKTRASNLEQRQIMEKNISMVTREIEKLHAGLADAENRTRAVTTTAAPAAANPGPAYNGNYANVDAQYGGSSYPDTYSMPQADAGLPYEGQGTHTPYENQTDTQIVSGAISNVPLEAKVIRL